MVTLIFRIVALAVLAGIGVALWVLIAMSLVWAS